MRIARMSVQGFRGISRPTTLDLANTDGQKPSSCLLFGENGSGKSTLVDALEFCLTARYYKPLDHAKEDYLKRLVNLSGNHIASVEIEFSDGSVFERTVSRNAKGVWEFSPASAHPRFTGTGIALRREDIVTFLRMPPARRQGVFASFMRSAAAAVSMPEETASHLELLESSKVDADTLRTSEAKKLAKLLRISNSRVLGHVQTVTQFENWFAAQGYIRKQLGRKPGGLTPDENSIFDQAAKVKSAVGLYRSAVLELDEYKKQTASAPLHQVLREVGESLTDSFHKISPSAQDVDEIKLEIRQGRIDLIALLRNGESLAAESFFSEANLDLLALLLFLSLLRFAGAHGQPKIMALDDVLQSVDAPIRSRVASYLLSEFSEWQLIVTFHDRLWKEQFAAIFSPKHQFVERETRNWSLNTGPQLIQVRRDASTYLRSILDDQDGAVVCGGAGYLLETISDWLSKYLQTSVTRRHGDKYTLGDTWPGVASALRKLETKDAVDLVDRYMYLRNMHGAHYNEWATMLSTEDSHSFGAAVLDLWERVWCSTCREPVGKHGNLVHCKCGGKTIERRTEQ